MKTLFRVINAIVGLIALYVLLRLPEMQSMFSAFVEYY